MEGTRKELPEVMKKVQNLWNRLFIRFDTEAAQSSIVERMHVAASGGASDSTRRENFLKQQRKDMNEYVETESAW